MSFDQARQSSPFEMARHAAADSVSALLILCCQPEVFGYFIEDSSKQGL
jgi:hypothetical protein